MGKVNLPASADELLREILRRLQALEAGAQTRVPMDTITGGNLQVQDAAANTYLFIGSVLPGFSGGVTQYGVLLYRQSGNESVGAPALTLFSGGGGPPQTLGLYDAAGNTLWTDDGLAGQGIGRPYLELGMERSDSANWPNTNSGSFQDMYFGLPLHQHPKVVASGRVICPTGVNAALQLTANGTSIGSTNITGNTGVAQTWSIGPVAWAGAHMAQMDMRLQARITSGSGTVQVALANFYGQQS
jgi:hypothetical protein